MRTIPLVDGPARIVGALDVERTETGLVPRRLPAWTRPQLVDEYLRLMVPRGSGVRLALRTDATAVEIDVWVTHFRNRFFPAPPVGFDLAIAGPARPGAASSGSASSGSVLSRPAVRAALHTVAAGVVVDRSAGAAETIRFDGLDPGWKDLEIWLPQASIVELRALRANGSVRESARTLPRWVHYGSSISQCAEAPGPTSTWPALVARRAGLDLTNLSMAGNCHLDSFVARTIRDLPAEIISLKVGINTINIDAMKERTFVPAVHGFLDTVRDGHPDTPIILMSPIVCPSAEERSGPHVQDEHGQYRATGPGDGLTLRGMRSLMRSVVDVRADPTLSYVDGLELLGEKDHHYLYDGLHPNADGYRHIAVRFHDIAFGPGGLLTHRAVPRP